MLDLLFGLQDSQSLKHRVSACFSCQFDSVFDYLWPRRFRLSDSVARFMVHGNLIYATIDKAECLLNAVPYWISNRLDSGVADSWTRGNSLFQSDALDANNKPSKTHRSQVQISQFLCKVNAMKGPWPDRSKNKDWVNKGSKPIFGIGLCPWLCEQKNVGVKRTLENEWEPSQFSLASGLTKNALWFIRWCVISTRFQLPSAHFSIILESSKAIKAENAKRQWKHGQKKYVRSLRWPRDFPWIQWILVQEPAIPTAKQTAGPLWASPKKPIPVQTEFRHRGLRFDDVWDPNSEILYIALILPCAVDASL